jgi:tetratricopeptide (TPR) repeat protein
MSNRKTAPAVGRRSQPALDVFEKAMKALAKRDYEKARDHFEQIASSYPEEHDVLERARTYRAMCDRALDKKGGPKPKTAEELVHQGVYLHNRGDYDDALKLLRQAADLSPKSEDVQYCLAATSARAGDEAAALKSLRAAVSLKAETRAQARTDPDFESLREEQDFQDILNGE